ncbi:hypothetical protein [Helicobacter turcicus]|uniref:DUF4355 domain-containing protein n=1 Tax=Helicobacter turcicus TaxID=2867412 RepID=A0ABS7JP78_9HELI|nr:hypothetical protein [Helicobacter turcicus]MBX7491214.1 hypothetical protein [Helicobacter turcicus]MBX7546147.1 hypothetical protein [Helicobacter turcicus]
MELNTNEKQELKELYKKLNNLYKERAKLEVLKKNREESLKEEIASVCEIKNKQGETDAKRVKMPLINAILDELYKEKPNKKEEEISLYETYKEAISRNKINKDCITNFLSSTESLNENAAFIKESFKDSTLLSKEVLDALSALLKEEYKLHLNDALSKEGYEIKEPKDNAELEALKELIKGLVG